MKKALLPCSFIAIFAIFLMLGGCTVTKKLSAADILSKTKLDFNTLTLDSVSINPNLFPQKGLGNGLLPNPQVVIMLQNFARGILEKEIGKAALTAELVATNSGTDTLWISSLVASLKVDTLMELPITLKDSIKLAPGENKFEVITQMPIDKRLFHLMEVNTLRFTGRMNVSLEQDEASFPMDFDIERKVTQEEKQELADRARESVINSVVNDWVGAILPTE